MSSGLPPLDQEFQIGMLLGATPLAQTFLATDKQGQEVVLKWFSAAATALPEFAECLRERCLAQARILHPNIAPIAQFGAIDGRPVLTMPFFRRGSLRSLTELPDGTRALLQRDLAIDLIWQAARVVAHVHAAGLIHANLKPSNLLLVAESLQIETRHGFHVLVSDFSIVPPLTVDQVDHNLIAPESRLYALPPEHYDPTGIGQIDARTDIYALGVMLYEALTGSPPFAVATYEDALTLHLYAQPPLDFPSRITEDVRPILTSCLARQPADRYQTARELAEALEALLPVRQRPALSAVPGRSSPGANLETNPQIRIFRGEERYDQRTYPFDAAGLLIGGGAQCGLQLPDLPDQLIQANWNGAQVSVTLLSNQLAVRIGNVAAATGRSMLWDWDQSLTAGPYTLRLQRPDVLLPQPTPALPVSEAPGTVEPEISLHDRAQRSDHLLMTVEPPTLVVVPGVDSRATLKIENRTPTVERVQVTIARNNNFIERWVRVPNTDVTCQGHGEASIPLIISVPKAPESRAGIHQVKLLVTSLVDRQGRELGEDAVRLTNDVDWKLDVQRFTAPALELRPKRLNVSRSARCSAFIRNDGNTTEEYRLSGADEPQLIDVETDKDMFRLTPGQGERVPIVLSPHQRIWYGRTERHDVKMTLASASPGNEVLVTAGVILDQQPVFKQWQLLLLIALLVLPFLCIFLFGIRTFRPLDKGVSRLPGYSILNPSATPTPTPTVTPTGLPTATPTLDPTQIALLVVHPPAIPTLTPIINPTSTPVPSLTPQPPPAPPEAGAATPAPVPAPAPAPPNPAPQPQDQTVLLPVPDGESVLCLPGEPILITGTGPAGAPIELFFDGRRVDSGQVNNPDLPVQIGDNGQFQIELRVGQEIPGRYPVEVRDVSQSPPTVLRSFTCQTFR